MLCCYWPFFCFLLRLYLPHLSVPESQPPQVPPPTLPPPALMFPPLVPLGTCSDRLYLASNSPLILSSWHLHDELNISMSSACSVSLFGCIKIVFVYFVSFSAGPQPLMFPSNPPVPLMAPSHPPVPLMPPTTPPVPLMTPTFTQPPSKERSSEDDNAGTNVDMQLDSPPLDSEL